MLGNNRLHNFSTDEETLLNSLTTLNLSMNNLSSMDISYLPRLRHLNLDSNCISTIHGLEDRIELDYISWRGQRLEEPEESPEVQYRQCTESRTLCLSGNRLQSFIPPNHFLSLQRLELASCGIEVLAEDFGICMPNLKSLNLNHNALKDLRPLLGIKRLTELHIAGNRVSRLRRTMAVLERMGSSLEVLDCRANPITIGFYAPAADTKSHETRLVVQKDRGIWDDGSREHSNESAATAYVVPAADHGLDEAYMKRLDRETVLRRRVYQLIILSSSPNLELLDGLKVDEEPVTRQDGTWEKLAEMGVVRMKSIECDDYY